MEMEAGRDAKWTDDRLSDGYGANSTLLSCRLGMLFFALIIAFLLHAPFIKFRTLFRVGYFLPNVTSIVAVAIIFGALFASNYGFLNYLLQSVGLPVVEWLNAPWGIKIAISSMVIWRWTGYNAIIYLAGLQSIPQVLVGNDGGAGAAGMTIVLYLYRESFIHNYFGYGAAVGWGMFLIIALFSIVNWKLVQGKSS